MVKKKSKSFKGLGPKYGATLRKKYTRVIINLKKKRICPKCGSLKFKREFAGIWKCFTCTYTVTGGAYDIELENS